MPDRLGTDEIVGIGHDINSAIMDALNNAKGRDETGMVQIQLVACGAEEIATGGAVSFWVRARRTEKEYTSLIAQVRHG